MYNVYRCYLLKGFYFVLVSRKLNTQHLDCISENVFKTLWGASNFVLTPTGDEDDREIKYRAMRTIWVSTSALLSNDNKPFTQLLRVRY